jgi:hypothetical protein
VSTDGQTILSLDLGYSVSAKRYGLVAMGETTVNTVTVKPVVSLPENNDLEAKITTLNFDALSTWQKLKNPANYKSSWVVMTQLIKRMDASFQLNYYSYYCSYLKTYGFQYELFIRETVLVQFSLEQQN